MLYKFLFFRRLFWKRQQESRILTFTWNKIPGIYNIQFVRYIPLRFGLCNPRYYCNILRYLSHLEWTRKFQEYSIKYSWNILKTFWILGYFTKFKFFGILFWKRLLESEIFSKYFMEYSWNIPGIFRPVQMWEVPREVPWPIISKKTRQIF